MSAEELGKRLLADVEEEGLNEVGENCTESYLVSN